MAEFVYHSLTEAERDAMLADTIHAREVERHCYWLNARNYEQLLAGPDMAALPEEWPAELARWKGRTRDEVAAGAAAGDQATIFALQHRDRLRHLLVTERIECGRVEQYHAQAVAAIPEARRAAALAKARLKRGA